MSSFLTWLQVISMHGSVIVCKASDEIVSLVRPTTIAITSPPESREFRLVHIPVQPDRPGYVLADEIVQMRVDLPADCRASSFRIRTSCSTTKVNNFERVSKCSFFCPFTAQSAPGLQNQTVLCHCIIPAVSHCELRSSFFFFPL